MTEHNSAPVRLAMIGGGDGAFIGEVHRMAARLDGQYELVAGAFSSDPARSQRSAAQFGLHSDRGYANVEALIAGERDRSDGMEAVVIVTPNFLHYSQACQLIEAGIHVICDKPVTTSAQDAESLANKLAESQSLFMVTYNYSGYAMVRQARQMVADGALGALRLVQVEYPQDWLARDIESSGQKQAAWRTDPAKAGPGGSLGDIGCHGFHLAEFVTGQQVSELLAELSSFVEGRRLDDNAQVLLRFASGARGALWASQVAVGHNNGLKIRVYGEEASLQWYQEQPEVLTFTRFGESPQVLQRGAQGGGDIAAALSRLPGGHPEGFLEGFANLYKGFAQAVVSRRSDPTASLRPELPGIEAGLRGMRFIEAAVNSAEAGNLWQTLE